MLSGVDTWSVFNQTITNMNDTANAQFNETVGQINTIQGQSMDPSDMGAYNLTMYGMNSIHDIQSNIVGPISQVQHFYSQVINQYNVPYDPSSIQPSQNVPMALNFISPIITNPSSFLPTHNVITAAGLILVVLVAARYMFFKH